MSLSRRTFLKASLLTSLSGNGLLLGCTRSSKQIISVPNASDASLGMWLRIGTDDRVIVIVPSAEMGQGVTTSLTTIIAEELDVELERLQIALAQATAESRREGLRIARLRWVVGPCGVAGPDEIAGPDRMPDAITKKSRSSLRRAYVPRAETPLRLHPHEASLSHASHFSEPH